VLNQTIEAVNRSRNGVPPPQQIDIAVTATTASVLPTKCRLVLTSSSTALSGVQTVDGSETQDKDYVLRTCDDDGDGVYRVNIAGSWARVARLSKEHGQGSAPVYDHGTVISIWDGDSAPTLYMTTIDDALET
jgi:hypothetical protein